MNINPPKTWGSFAEQPKNETIEKLVGLLSVYCLMMKQKPPGANHGAFDADTSFKFREADEICVAGLIFSSYCLTYKWVAFFACHLVWWVITKHNPVM